MSLNGFHNGVELLFLLFISHHYATNLNIDSDNEILKWKELYVEGSWMFQVEKSNVKNKYSN